MKKFIIKTTMITTDPVEMFYQFARAKGVSEKEVNKLKQTGKLEIKQRISETCDSVIEYQVVDDSERGQG